MTNEEWFAAELARLEIKWVEGDVAAVGEAIALCGWNGWPLPEWCVAPALDGLSLLNNRGKRGQSPPRAKTAALAAQRHRHELVAFLLSVHGKKLTVDKACEEAAAILKRQNVSARAVRESYYEVERKRTPK